MKDISRLLKKVYNARSAIIVPGSGSFGMEAVARQFATDQRVLVIRNGWFSFRWTQIFDMGRIPHSVTVLKARQVGSGAQAPSPPARSTKSSPPSVPSARPSFSHRTSRRPPA
jgi:aspartate aminotransferase-like enzyme